MLDTALKEWAVVCDLLAAGELAILLRKGGVHEDEGPGRFRLEHDRFALFPAWEHQQPERIKAEYRDQCVEYEREPETLTLHAYGEVTPRTIWQVPSVGGRAAFDRLGDLHVWTKPQIDMRFDYKPERPLYLLAVRVYELAGPKTIPNRPAYAGCRSWVPLDEADAVDVCGATPVLSDAGFAQIVQRVEAAMRLETSGLDDRASETPPA